MEALKLNTEVNNPQPKLQKGEGISQTEAVKSGKVQVPKPVKKEPEYSNVIDTPNNRRAIESAIKALEIFQPNHPNTRFQYQVHDETGHIQVALVNYLTGEVVEEVPSSKLLEYASRMEELSGLVLEEKA
ncbi:MAG: flagellar protein FlaG [Spirochaetia bacterium]|nr:flagellar protein FlaG [Spirochaetia bacterium]